MIEIVKFNEVFLKIHCDESVAQELADYFTFEVPNAKFHPLVKKKKWDGKIRLFNKATHHIYVGLIDYIVDFAKQSGYDCVDSSDIKDVDITHEQIEKFISTLNLPETINGKPLEKRDYQLEAVRHAIAKRRALLISPTASGKSLIIYLLYRFYNKRTLLVVPTTSLIHQMKSDFKDYGYDVDNNCHLIYTGQEKNSNAQLYISTWQSISKLPKKWFDKFDVILGDEAHTFQATSLKNIMHNLSDCEYRVGFTGTLSDSKTHKLVLEGLFGRVMKVTTTRHLMDSNYIASLKIKAILLKYEDHIRRLYSKAKYQKEIEFLVTYTPRNNFIADLALSLKGNTLILYLYVDKHGKELYNIVRDKAGDRKVFFVSGQITGEDRDQIRRDMDVETDSITIASYGTFSTGINTPNLHNVILASPTKSRIRLLQSIGRSLRKSTTKNKACLYDISDDMQWKDTMNHTLKHYIDRIRIYNSEKFEYKTYSFNIKG